MELKQIAEELGVEVESCLRRFAGNEALYIKFLGKFVDDNSMQELRTAYQNKDLPGVESGAHSLKGVCANLGLARLAKIAGEIVNAVREGKTFEQIEEQRLQEQCEKEYQRVCRILEK